MQVFYNFLTDLFLEETTETFVCEHKTLDITCPADKQIEIISANYGRTVSIRRMSMLQSKAKFL